MPTAASVGACRLVGMLAALALFAASGCGAAHGVGSTSIRRTAPAPAVATRVFAGRPTGAGRHDGDGDVDLQRRTGWDSDNDALPSFGAPASAAERDAIVAAIRRYYAVADRGDGAAACAMLDPTAVEALLEAHRLGSLPPSRQVDACERVVSSLLVRHRVKLREETSAYRVSLVQVRGRKAYVLVRFHSRREVREQQLLLRRMGGGWRMQQPLDGAAV